MSRLVIRLAVAAGIFVSLPEQSRAQGLSDAELWSAIVKANPGKSQRDMLRIFVCHKKDPVCQTVDTEFKGLTAAQLAAIVSLACL